MSTVYLVVEKLECAREVVHIYSLLASPYYGKIERFAHLRDFKISAYVANA